MFIVSKYELSGSEFQATEASIHAMDRVKRFRAAKALGPYKIIRTFEVDKGHPNGPEIHAITNTGVIYIFNAWTGRLITCLIARPGQIRRYYEEVGEHVPQWLVDLAKKHLDEGLNFL